MGGRDKRCSLSDFIRDEEKLFDKVNHKGPMSVPVFIPDMPFQLSLKLANKAVACQSEEPFR